MRKYKNLDSKTKASRFMQRILQQHPDLFAHWKEGMKGAFA